MKYKCKISCQSYTYIELAYGNYYTDKIKKRHSIIDEGSTVEIRLIDDEHAYLSENEFVTIEQFKLCFVSVNGVLPKPNATITFRKGL